MLHQGNIWCFDYAISHLPSEAPIVEIGSFCGLSTNVITYLKQKYGKLNKLICSDAWIFEGAEKGGALGKHPYIKHHDYQEFVKSTFEKNISFFSCNDLPFPIEMFSDNFFLSWKNNTYVSDIFNRQIKLGGLISFAYIDGNHSYEFALRDFINVDQYLEPGGFILFDDSADWSDWGVRRVVTEVSRSGRYQLIKKNPNYFFQKQVC
ncbi:MAG: hypothetical protein C6Y22_21395 [Hapalosiphonaceae cyanobacterium JJU2]|nr:MAG: hypothetical protein C6Y22_21395 [Hapalosiphonaceae cyanobacterium JJU2]